MQQTPILSNQKIVNPIQLSKMRKYIPNNLFALVLTIGSDLILCENFLKKNSSYLKCLRLTYVESMQKLTNGQWVMLDDIPELQISYRRLFRVQSSE